MNLPRECPDAGHGLSPKPGLADSYFFAQGKLVCRLNRAWCGGEWLVAEDGTEICVHDPADGSVLGAVPNLGVAGTRRAIEAAQSAWAAWRACLPQERSDKLETWHDLILKHKEDLALLMTAEQGKPLRDARGEVDYAASFVKWFAEEGKRLNGETICSHLPDRKMFVQREPLGVIAAVTPWNFPLAMITRKAAAALAAACPVIVVPSLETPFSALALAELAQQAGIPGAVFSVLTGDAPVIVNELCGDPRVRGLSFTGSTEVGRILMAKSAMSIKRLSFELGGQAPFIVFDDVDLDKTVKAAVQAKFQTGGQDCLAANRIYVHSRIYGEFVEKFSRDASALRVGSGFNPDTDIGPLMNEKAVTKCREHLEDAVKKGARVTHGGRLPEPGSLFFEPAVLADVTSDMKIASEETFGPVAALIPFRDESEVLAAANHTEFGLMAYVFTRDLSRAWRVSDALEYGMVGVNSIKVTGAPVPFGGIKQSGLGREGSRQGIEEFTELKYVCMEV